MPPTYNEIMAWNPELLGSIANGMFELKAHVDAEAPKAGNPVINLTSAQWKGRARVSADARAEGITRWLRGVADEYGDLGSALTSGSTSIRGAMTALQSKTTEADNKGYVVDRASRSYTVTFDEARASGAKYDAALAFDYQRALSSLGAAADTAVTSTRNAINTALAEIAGISPASIAANSGTMTRVANQVQAFRQVYGRAPMTENDWRVAAVLDPHSYNPKNKGVPPVISVLRIKPVPGQGIVRTGLFIPLEKVAGGLDDHLGDNRGFNANFSPEDTRVTYVIDYENGLVIARQNPSVNADTGEVRTGRPKVSASQLPDGTVAIKYDAADPFAPPGAAVAGWSANGQTVVTPGPDGARISGRVTDYPSMEVYQHMPGGHTRTLHRDGAGDHGEWGPALHLPLHHTFDDYNHDIDRFPQERTYAKTGPLENGYLRGTSDFGSPEHPPTAKEPR